MKRYLSSLIKILFTAGLLWWFLSRSNFTYAWQLLTSLAWPLFLLAILLNFLALIVNSVKWRLLLPDFSWLTLFRTNLIGQYYSTLLPGQLAGEAAKAYLLGGEQQQIHRVTASILVDKITGLLGGVFIVGIFGLLFTKQNLPVAWLTVFLIAGISLTGLLIIVRISYFYEIIFRIINYFRQHFKWGASFWTFLIKLMDFWRCYAGQSYVLITSILLGIVYQFISILMTLILADQIGLTVSFVDWCWIWAVLSLVLLLPITIAGLGLREGTLIGILGLLGVLPAQAIALSLSLFGVQIIIAFVGGVLEFRRWYYQRLD